jgi:two-component system, NarL family, invasion response regulator UvrY
MIKVLIVDNHYIFRSSIRQILLEEKDFYILGEASNSEVISNQMYTIGFDVLIIDIEVNGTNGYEVLGELKKRNPELKILVLGLNNEEEVAARIINSGADGYITKDSASKELVYAIRQICNYKKYIGITAKSNFSSAV